MLFLKRERVKSSSLNQRNKRKINNTITGKKYGMASNEKIGQQTKTWLLQPDVATLISFCSLIKRLKW
jgi:hypothetical protein